MFERAYTLRSFDWTDRETMTGWINAAIAEHDHPQATASIACMTSDREQVHILIEYWRSIDNGDREQAPTRPMDSTPALRQPRRPRAKANDHTRATQRDQPAGLDQSVEPATRFVRDEIDVALPTFTGFHAAGCGIWEHRPCTCRGGEALPDGPIEWP